MTERFLLLVALLLPSCSSPAPYPCLAPVNLNLSEPLASYDFSIDGQVADGTFYGNAASCPRTFSGGDCDESRISLRDIDNQSVVLDLRVLVGGQAVFDGRLTIDAISDASCTSGGTREVDVVL